jgi:DNA-binding NarL/FixJ family response regulator
MRFGLVVKRHVVVAERDTLVRAAVVALVEPLGLGVVQAKRGMDVLAAVTEPEATALVLLSVDLNDPCGYEVLHRLHERFGRSVPIAMLAATGGSEDRDEVAALLLGADDYFYKPLQPDGFVARVRRLTVPQRPGRGRGSAPLVIRPRLTNREREVLTLLVDGYRSAEIAQLLCITRKTAATHIERILAKLEVHTQAQAVACALREGIVGTAPGPSLAMIS